MRDQDPPNREATRFALFAGHELILSNTSIIDRVAPSRGPVWLTLAGVSGGVGAALLGVAASFDVAASRYSFWTSLPMIVAYVIGGLALTCAVCAVYEVPFFPPLRRWSKDRVARQVPGADPAGWAAADGVPSADGAPTPAARIWRPVTQWEPLDLDIHPAIDVGTSGDLPVMPPYVRREHDNELDHLLVGADGSAMFVVTGTSSTGKSRAAYEALIRHPVLRSWPLCYPRTSAELIQLLVDALPPSSVLWLNETQDYLRGADGEKAAVLLRHALEGSRAAPLIVAGTMWPKYWEELTNSGSAEEGMFSQYVQVRQLLLHAVRRIRISPLTQDQAAAMASKPGGDPRLHEAAKTAQGGEVIQVLAGGPVLLQCYSQPDSDDARFGAAITVAAASARLLGHQAIVPEELLRQGAIGYLDPAACEVVPDDWITRGLGKVITPVLGIRALAPHYAAGQMTLDGYLLHDYLYQHLSPGPGVRVPPPSLWEALAKHTVSGVDRVRLAKAADDRGLYRLAVIFATPAADAGDVVAMRLLAVADERAGKAADAQRWVRSAADAGDVLAMRDLIELWKRAGRVADAEEWLRQYATYGAGEGSAEAADLLGSIDQDARIQWLREHADRGDAGAIWRLVEMLGPEKCLPWLIRAANDGHTWAMRELAESLPVAESESWLRRAAAAGDVQAMKELAYMLRDTHRGEEALPWLRRAAQTGDEMALWSLGEHLAERGDTAEAITLLQRLNSTDPDDMEEVSALLERVGGPDVAEQWLRDVAQDDLVAGLVLTQWLRKHGRSTEAKQSLLIETEAGNPFAWMELAQLLQRTGQTDEAGMITRRMAVAGDSYMMTELAAYLDQSGYLDDARQWWRRSAQAGAVNAMLHLAGDLERDGELGEAEMWLRRATEARAHDGLAGLACFLRRNNREDEAGRLLRFGIEPGGTTAAPW